MNKAQFQPLKKKIISSLFQGWTGVNVEIQTICPMSFSCIFGWVIYEIGVNKLIKHTGQKQIMIDIAEFSANTTNLTLSHRKTISKANILS